MPRSGRRRGRLGARRRVRPHAPARGWTQAIEGGPGGGRADGTKPPGRHPLPLPHRYGRARDVQTTRHRTGVVTSVRGDGG